jgi:hypothetical protein
VLGQGVLDMMAARRTLPTLALGAAIGQDAADTSVVTAARDIVLFLLQVCRLPCAVSLYHHTPLCSRVAIFLRLYLVLLTRRAE